MAFAFAQSGKDTDSRGPLSLAGGEPVHPGVSPELQLPNCSLCFAELSEFQMQVLLLGAQQVSSGANTELPGLSLPTD